MSAGRRKENIRIPVMGVSRYGKSYFIKHRILPPWDRVFVLDPMAEYGPHVEAIVETPAQAKAWLLERGAGHHLMPFKLACISRAKEQAAEYLRLAWHLPDSLVVVEEVHKIAWPGWVPPELAELIDRGRHRRISVVCSTQRPAKMPTDIRSAADVLVAFRLKYPRDIEAVKYEFSDGADRLLSLGVGEHLISGNLELARHFGMDLRP